MELRTILNGIDGVKAKADLNVNIEMIESDSRKIKQNAMFVAIKGFDLDGSLYIKQAIENGAIAIVIEEGTKLKKSDINEDTNVIQNLIPIGLKNRTQIKQDVKLIVCQKILLINFLVLSTSDQKTLNFYRCVHHHDPFHLNAMFHESIIFLILRFHLLQNI